MLKEQHADPAPVKLLVEVLKRTPGIGSAPDPQRLSADPKAISLFSGAFVDAQKETMRTSEFLKRISDLIDGLESNDRERRKESQEQMRVFCLSLHDKVLADKFPYKETETVFGDGMRAVGLR
jgi:hypothetical protein